MRERDIEKYLVQEVWKAGGKAYKWSSINNNAVPDRILFFPGLIKFVECKAPGKSFSPLQKQVAKFLRTMGHEVLLVDTKQKIDILIAVIKEELKNE